MLTDDPRWHQYTATRVALSLWDTAVIAVARVAAQMAERGYQHAAASLESYARSIEQSAERELNKLLKEIPETGAAEPTNGHAELALEILNTPIIVVDPGAEKLVEQLIREAPAVSRKLAVNTCPSEPESHKPDVEAATLLVLIEQTLTHVRERQRRGPPAQELDIADKRLCEARGQARDSRMLESARTKYAAVLKLLNGGNP